MRYFAFLCSVFLLGACASRPRAVVPSPSLTAVSVDEPVVLQLKPAVGRKDTTDYYHKSISEAFQGNELSKTQEESVSYTTEAVTLRQNESGKTFLQALTTTSKDGVADLKSFAMPELHERLDFELKFNGEVVRAGQYPKNSLFYVPSLALPEGPVNIGDTWTYKTSWVSLQDQVPFDLETTYILKGFVACGNGDEKDECADLEVWGTVTLGENLKKVFGFESSWKGRALLARKAGVVVWSRMDTSEAFESDTVKRRTRSCFEARLREPISLRLPAAIQEPTCEPAAAD